MIFLNKRIYIEKNNIRVDKEYIEKFGEDILILADHKIQLYSGNLMDFHSDSIKEELLKDIKKLELFVKIKNKYFYVDKTFILEDTAMPKEIGYEQQIKKLIMQLEDRIEDYIS